MFRNFIFIGFVNIAIIFTITIILNVTGLNQLLLNNGANLFPLFLFCLVWGMGGAFISLLISKWMAKTFMGIQLVSLNGPHHQLVHTVHRLARRAGLAEMPEVGIYQSDVLNAFATGPSRNNSLVAVSTGLLQFMNEDEIEGVLAHEVSHIANGDMVTMTLVQGVMNAFVMFFARIVAYLIDQSVKDNDRNGRGMGPFAYSIIVMLLQIVFGILASFITNWFSRYREFRADEGGANLASKEKMIMALKALDRAYPQLETSESDQRMDAIKSFQISSKASFSELFSTHPNLKLRIATLEKLKLY